MDEFNLTGPEFTLDGCLAEGRALLAEAAAESGTTDVHPREALLLLAEASGLDRAQVLARGERVLEASTVAAYRRMLERRAAAEPVAYILGRKEFYGREMRVDPRVLIPRPETEHLVEAAVARLRRLGSAPRVLDVGTGSGCIAVTLACEVPGTRVIASDVSPAALEVARYNARRLDVADRVRFVAADLTSALRLESFDMVVSNPPYVSPEAAAEMSPEVREYEPHGALFAEGDGRDLITALLDAALDLPPGAPVLVEIGWDQGEWIEAETRKRPGLAWQELIHDYGGHGRIAVLERAGASKPGEEPSNIA